MDRYSNIVALFAAGIVALSAGALGAAELQVLSGGAMRAALQDLAAAFEQSSGHKLVIEYGTVAKVAEKVIGGDPVEVAVLTRPPLDRLMSGGKILAGSATRLAHVPIGAAVKAGAPKPEISSIEAFKAVLLAARIVTHGDPGMGDAAGVHVVHVIETLGVTAAVTPKTRLISPPPGQSGAQFLSGMVQRGETELAIAPISVLSETRGIEIVGLLPAELQSPDLTFFAATPSTCRYPAEAKALIDFLAGDAAKPLYRAKGMDPG